MPIRYLSIFFLLAFFAKRTDAQMQLTPGEEFLTGLNIVKVKVTPEDHTVWALAANGTVYYKKESDSDFQVYPLTVGMVVSHLAGFNANEMYFHVAPDKLIQIMNNVSTIIPVSFPGVTRINDIVAVNQDKESPNYQPAISYDDWIAIATNKHMYRLIRGTSVIKDQYPYYNTIFYDEQDWDIMNDGFKSVDFRYRNPGWRCFDSDHVYHNSIAHTIYESVIPEVSPYPSKVNCSLFAINGHHPFTILNGSLSMYNYWGTDEGLYLKEFGCSNTQRIKKVIAGQVINEIEEIHALTSIYRQNYLLVATNTGVWYTPASIFSESEFVWNSIDKTVFIPLSSFPSQQVNSICADTKEYESIGVSGGYTYTPVCEKVIWIGANNGIRKVYVDFDQSKFDMLLRTSFKVSKNPVYDSSNNATFETCGTEAVDLTLKVPDLFLSQILIQWFKDGVEVPDLLGKKTVQLSQNGTYKAKITSLCEGVYMWSIQAIIKNSTEPEITFNYPPEMNLCEGKTTTLTTASKPGYQYRWLKDNQVIPSATSSSYIVNQGGVYRVEVSNCANNFQSSSSVNVNAIPLAIPIIQSVKNTYCVGETADLQIATASSNQIHWYLNGNELPQYLNENKIAVTTSGGYTALVENPEGCKTLSASFKVEFVSAPDVKIIKSKNSPLCNSESVTLSTNQSDGEFLWSTGEITSFITVNKPGVYSVEVANSTGCSTFSDVNIEMLPPLVLTEPSVEKVCTISSEKIILEAESGYRFYTWNGVKTNSNTLAVVSPGSYVLTIEDSDGCTATKVYTVTAWCKDIIIPNTFTPNNDGNNDFWAIGGLEEDNNVKLFVYNRNGNLVYEKSGCCINWDGQLNNTPLPIGTYFYVLTASNSDKPLKGTVTILR